MNYQQNRLKMYNFLIDIGNDSNFINICCKTCLGSHFSIDYKVSIPTKYQEEVIKNLIQANEEHIMKEFKYEQSIYNME